MCIHKQLPAFLNDQHWIMSILKAAVFALRDLHRCTRTIALAAFLSSGDRNESIY